MKYLDVVLNFEKHLTNKKYKWNTVRLYSSIIKELVKEYNRNPRIDDINKFLKKKKNKTSYYAVKYFLLFRWRNADVNRLDKILTKNNVRIKKFVSRKKIKQLLDVMGNDEYRLITIFQYFTGAKINEILSIKKDDIIHESNNNRICINIRKPGGDTDPIYLDDVLWPDIEKVYIKNRKYLFLNDCDEEINKQLKIKYYKYYFCLKESCEKINLNINTEDIRWSFAKAIENNGVDVIEIHQALRNKNLSTTINYMKNEKIAKTMLKHQKKVFSN